MKPKLFNRRAFVRSAAARNAVAGTQRRTPPVQQSQSTAAAENRNPPGARLDSEDTLHAGTAEQMA